MILNSTKLKQRVQQSGLTEQSIATAITRPGLDSMSAVRNWTRGNLKPTPKREDLTKLANALNVDVKSIVRFEGIHRWARISPRKVRLVSDMIRGQDIDSALTALRFSKKRAAVFVRKAVESAIASAEEVDADLTRLFVAESRVDGGPIIKRFQPKDRGKSYRINKRTSHIIVALEEG